uniref:Apple domain-containing protein n=1 Tax=Ascaris lumbricoides TaxID=6252 RepID=A0A0M3I8B3_ASCLU
MLRKPCFPSSFPRYQRDARDCARNCTKRTYFRSDVQCVGRTGPLLKKCQAKGLVAGMAMTPGHLVISDEPEEVGI